MSEDWYDQATDAFCRALGLETRRVTHLTVGPRYTIATILVFDAKGAVVGETQKTIKPADTLDGNP